MACCGTLFTITGFITIAILIYKFFYELYLIVYPHIVAKILGRTLNLKSLGKWAVITGSTDGIGKSYAKELAKKGINVYLISRSEEKLKATADEIRKINSNVEIKTLPVDFQKVTPATFRTTMADELKNLEIGILVNNVGMSYEYPEEFLKASGGEEFLQNIVLVNDASALQMTKLILPSMLKRDKGAVINISSSAAFYPFPYLTVYSCTKIFLDYFTRGLRDEYSDTNVIFQVINPFYVVTKMSGLRRSNFWAPDPDTFAKSALDTVGLVGASSGCLSHDLQRFAMKLAIAILPKKVIADRFKIGIKQIRDKFLRQQQKQTKEK